ncbi:MAG TPA: hypothetical protein VK449_08475 [Anaerolineales bacterium]|nr:hypothetical protein [Anaerolineales bacterium]
MNGDQAWKPKTLAIGALIGALTGLAGAYLLVRRAEATGTRPQMDPGEGIRISLLVMGLLRQVALIGESKQQS